MSIIAGWYIVSMATLTLVVADIDFGALDPAGQLPAGRRRRPGRGPALRTRAEGYLAGLVELPNPEVVKLRSNNGIFAIVVVGEHQKPSRFTPVAEVKERDPLAVYPKLS